MVYTAPPLTGAPNLVKNQRLDIAIDGAPGSYVYNEVVGVKSLSEGNSYSEQDVATFNTGVRAAADMPTQFKKTITGTLQDYIASNPTHVMLRSAGDTLTLIALRYYDRTGNGPAFAGTAFVKWEPQGGSGEQVKTNNFTLGIQDWDPITNPAAVAAVVATITTALPPSKTTGDWIELIGTGLDTVTAVTVGGTAVATNDRLLISPTRMHIKLPAGTSGVTSIVATNPAGASAGTSYTRT